YDSPLVMIHFWPLQSSEDTMLIPIRAGECLGPRRASQGVESGPLVVPRRGVQGTDITVRVDLGTECHLGPEAELLVRTRRFRWAIPASDVASLSLCQDCVAGIAESHRRHAGVVCQRNSDRLAGGCVPEPRRPVPAAGEDHAAIGAERQRVYRSQVV